MTEHERRDGARPRLDLPRFEFGVALPARGAAAPLGGAPARPAGPSMQMHAPGPRPFATSPFGAPAPTHAAPTYAPVAPPVHHHVAQPVHHAPQHAAPTAPQPYMHGAAAPVAAPVVHHHVPAPAPQHAVVPAHALAPTPAPVRTSPSISWERLEQPEDERTWLQKITPMHMGFLIAGVVLLMIISSKPGAVRSATTALPSGVAGGGTAMPVQPHATISAPVTTSAAPVVEKTIRIGTATLPVNAAHGGIPTAAASEAMAQGVSGGGGPVADDGATLPRSAGERDAPARDVASGGGGETADPPATPVISPAQSAMMAEQRAARHLDVVSGGGSSTEIPRIGVS